MTDDDSFTRYAKQEARRMALAMQLREATKETLFHILAAHRIARLSVIFDGEGDSGQIEETIAANAAGQPADLPAEPLTIQTAKPDGSGPEETTLPVASVIEALCYELLEEKYPGWEIDDGSYGEFVVNVADRTIQLTFNGRFTDVDTSIDTF